MRTVSDEAAASKALAEFCQRCWYPIYAFVRRSGAGSQDAEDLTQGFFHHLLTHDLMGQARREKGRFRSFLLACLKHYMANEWQKNPPNAEADISPQCISTPWRRRSAIVWKHRR